MSKKLKLTGRKTMSSPLLYGTGLTINQVVNLRDSDADKLLLVMNGQTPVFTQVADNTTADFDLTSKYPDPELVVTQAGKLFAGSPISSPTGLAEIAVGGTSDLANVTFTGSGTSKKVTGFLAGGTQYTITYPQSDKIVISWQQGGSTMQKTITVDADGDVIGVKTVKL